ncbi:cdkn1a interacting zinc finger protein 1a isoform X5 [Synchiropus splendidus]|uniref:cdkn1a interacting zinc finger protein 1a isoform X5 n=1 Tax=Synchiropus splendidus TaxID=270530 RepID=UPI00237EBD51|nr:cdkn1a interacting zinc finger protein 1a isoform X5 [Synchiropus splendidus]
MFNPHIHQQQQQQQQQQQFHQHLRQLQQLFQQQPPPPAPPQPSPGHHVGPHHHQTPRPMPVPPQAAAPPRMVRMCQATQTTIITPNPMLQGAIMMQQMQGSMRNFGMGGQQFRQFFGAGGRSSLLGPVPIGMTMKGPMRGFPIARTFSPHTRFFNNMPATTTPQTATTATTAATLEADGKRDSEQMTTLNTEDQLAASCSTEAQTDGAAVSPVDNLEEPVVKKPKTDRSEDSKKSSVEETTGISDTDAKNSSESSSNMDGRLVGGELLVDKSQPVESDAAEVPEITAQEASTSSSKLMSQGPDAHSQQNSGVKTSDQLQSVQEDQEGDQDSTNKFYCYLCSVTCNNQQNFKSHMNSVAHQQRMMEIQHVSNACLVTLLPRVQESLLGTNKDGEKRGSSQRWCSSCNSHFSGNIKDHRRSEEHRLTNRSSLSSCTVCKRRFRTSQMFVEHLQSAEHRLKVEKLQETLSSLTSSDADGFLLEEGEESELEDERMMNEEDSLGNLGSSFFVPVAGFICRLCNKFYHFDSSSLHTHCKSLTHFENLKRHKSSLSRLEAESSPGERAFSAETEPTTDSSPLLLNFSSTLTSIPFIGPDTGDEDATISEQNSQTLTTSAMDQELTEEGEPTAQESSEKPPGDGEQNEDEVEDAEAVTVPAKKKGAGKAKAPPTRRSGRAANRH